MARSRHREECVVLYFLIATPDKVASSCLLFVGGQRAALANVFANLLACPVDNVKLERFE